MKGREMILAARLGIGPQAIADKLNTRNASGDDRRVCLECASLDIVLGSSAVMCDPVKAKLVMTGKAVQVGKEWVTLLQRCPGFRPASQ